MIPPAGGIASTFAAPSIGGVLSEFNSTPAGAGALAPESAGARYIAAIQPLPSVVLTGSHSNPSLVTAEPVIVTVLPSGKQSSRAPLRPAAARIRRQSPSALTTARSPAPNSVGAAAGASFAEPPGKRYTCTEIPAYRAAEAAGS